MRIELFMYFVLRITSGPRVKFVDSKRSLNPTVVYAIDRSMAVDPVLFLFCVDLTFILRGASCLILPCSLSFFFFSPFSIVITSLGEGVGLCASLAFVFFFCCCLFVFFCTR